MARHLLKRSYQSSVPTTAPSFQRELPQSCCAEGEADEDPNHMGHSFAESEAEPTRPDRWAGSLAFEYMGVIPNGQASGWAVSGRSATPATECAREALETGWRPKKSDMLHMRLTHL